MVGAARTSSYFEFEESALNTGKESIAKRLINEGHRPSRITETTVLPLTTLLRNEDFPKSFDLLSVDVEGMDYEVLKSIDLNEYSVAFIMVETGLEAWEAEASEIGSYLAQYGYVLVASFLRSQVFRKRD